MQKIFLTLALLASWSMSWAETSPMVELQDVTLQLRWAPQAQFMGYYVADTLGFYEREGLNVSIVPGGPHSATLENLDDEVDFSVEWLGAALEARQHKQRVVNIAQILQHSSLMLICRKESGIHKVEDIKDTTISTWEGSSALGFQRWLESLEISTLGEGNHVSAKLVPQVDVVESWQNLNIDCVSATSYNEYWRLLDAGLQLRTSTIFRLAEQNNSLLEDGLYVSQNRLADPEFLNKAVRFTRASLAGWAYATNSPAEAVEILVQRFPSLDRVTQLRMAKEIIRLIDAENLPLGRLAVDRFVEQIEFLGYDIEDSNRDEVSISGAWTHAVWRQLDNYEHSPFSDEVLYRLERILESPVFHLLDLLGTLAFGLAGFARASERRYDIWGALILTSLPAVGGGIIRDVLVGGDRHPPFVFSDPIYIYIVMGIVATGTLWDRYGPTGKPLIDTNSSLFLAIDTIGLAAFAIIGAKVAILAQLDWYWIPMLAATSCAGGGVMMDVVTGREPRTFRGVVYEEIAILGGLMLLVLLYAAQFASNVALFIQAALIQTFILVYVTRIVVVQKGLSAPRLGARLQASQ